MLNRRDFGKFCAAVGVAALLPFKARAKIEYYTTFTSPIPAEELGYAPQWYPPDGLVSPEPVLPGDIVIRGYDGIERDGKSRWVLRDGDRVLLGLHSEADHLRYERVFAAAKEFPNWRRIT